MAAPTIMPQVGIMPGVTPTIIPVSGVPTNGTSGTLAGVAAAGGICQNTATGTLYHNTGTISSPTWTAYA